MIISGFPCIGKSEWANKCKNVVDLDSSSYSHRICDDWPSDYIDDVINLHNEGKIVLISTHRDVREELKKRGQQYTVIYPTREQKTEYVARAESRVNHPLHPNVLKSSFDIFIGDLDVDIYPSRIRMKSGQYLSDVTHAIAQLAGIGEPSAVCCGKNSSLAEMLSTIQRGTMEDPIYMACPYSDASKAIIEQRFRMVSECAAVLIDMGYYVVSPVTYGHSLARFADFENEWKVWMKISGRMMDPCRHMILLTLDGCRKSKGVALETEIATERGMEYATASYLEIITMYEKYKKERGR